MEPSAYADHPVSVELVETHVSWLFLTGARVYKVKKPVDFGFLDFTTLEKRQRFCEREVALNRRLSPDVYLGVVEIRRDGERFSVGGQGETVEYAVEMRQLRREQALRELLRRGQVTLGDIKRIATRVATFHRSAESSEETARLGGYGAVTQNVRENFEQTQAYVGRTIERGDYEELRAYSEAFLDTRRPEFLARERAGWVRNCHGDLHAAQVFLEDGIQIIDCIEFNERMRYSDVAADIAFLAMDLDFHGRRDLSGALVEAYQKALGDSGFLRFLDFFKVYRAYVRGKVEGFRLGQPGLTQSEEAAVRDVASRYFKLALSYLRPLPRPTLFVIMGLMGTGKTRLAQALSGRWRLEHISSDVVRKELAGIGATEHRYVPFGQGIYDAGATERTYGEMFRRAGETLKQGRSVVLDASFSKASHRREAAGVAAAAGAPVRFLLCTASDDVIRRRLDNRMSRPGVPSDGRWELYAEQKAAFAPPEGAHSVIDTSSEPHETLYQAMRACYTDNLREDVVA